MPELVLVLNALWFAMGFHLFSIRSRILAKLVVAREHRDTPVFESLIMSGKSLGEFNLAFSVLNILLLVNTGLFDKDLHWAIILFATAIAHATKFAFNVPVALQNRRGIGVCQVRGLMQFIFVTDFVLTTVNGVLAALYFLWISDQVYELSTTVKAYAAIEQDRKLKPVGKGRDWKYFGTSCEFASELSEQCK